MPTRPAAAASLARAVGFALVLAAVGCDSIGETPGPVGARAEESGPRTITALGRLQPKDGIIRIAGPSRPTVVIAALLVDTGDRVEPGQPIAVLDTLAENTARVARVKAELANAQTELGRVNELFRQGITAVSLREGAQLKVDVARAEVAAAQSALDLDTVRAPAAGQVIEIHARRGERVGPEGIAELADTARMYAVAQVYETDIGRVKVGQRASMTSPALPAPLTGTVERIGMKIGRLDVLDTDPAARTDARVVPVDIKLDDSTRGAALSNLQLQVAIEPD
ncbi:MAG TPA: efflux RND transporter periplasmic adaptor subunit [Candidatus Binatia bacterium]|nr:efflux RND transporter periplasmic adaptor subunit [Candidatus Binatia bacterium]